VQGRPRTLTGPERAARGVVKRALGLVGRPSASRQRFLPPLPALRAPPHPAPPPAIPALPLPPASAFAAADPAAASSPPPTPLPPLSPRHPPCKSLSVAVEGAPCGAAGAGNHVGELGWGAMGGGVLEEGGAGQGGGSGAGVARGRQGHDAWEGGWGSAAGAVRLRVRRGGRRFSPTDRFGVRVALA